MIILFLSLFFSLNKKIKKRGEGEENTLPNYEKKKMEF